MTRRWPAEWERHEATWIAWPHHEPDWPGKLEPIPWVYAEIVRALHAHERVEILCHDEAVLEDARAKLEAHGCAPAGYRLHLIPSDRVWLRDSAPTAVHDADGAVVLLNWAFNAWAKYDNYALDRDVGCAVERITGHRRVEPLRPDGGRVILEGGAIETNGLGLLMVTEECLLSPVQERNPGLDRAGYEQVFRRWLGVDHTIWLGEGCEGDDTHGHIDDIARFVDASTVVAMVEEDSADANHAPLAANLRRLRAMRDQDGKPLAVVPLPMPPEHVVAGQRCPASYANFLLVNGGALVPTFGVPEDARALAILREVLPGRDVIPVPCGDLVLGLGTIHCLSQQEPA